MVPEWLYVELLSLKRFTVGIKTGEVGLWKSELLNCVHFQSVFIRLQMSPKEGKYAFSVSVSLIIAPGINSLWISIAHMSTWDPQLCYAVGWEGICGWSNSYVLGAFDAGICPAIVPVPKLMPR